MYGAFIIRGLVEIENVKLITKQIEQQKLPCMGIYYLWGRDSQKHVDVVRTESMVMTEGERKTRLDHKMDWPPGRANPSESGDRTVNQHHFHGVSGHILVIPAREEGTNVEEMSTFLIPFV